MDWIDEDDLVGAARAGDHEAWEVLYRRVYSRLRAYVVRRIGQRLADDVMGETLTRAVEGITRLDLEQGGFDAWMFGIARHVCADQHRRALRQRSSPDDFAQADQLDPGCLPGEALEGDVDQERVRRLFAMLSPDERELLQLRVMVGLSADEVAVVLGRSPGAVRTAQSRALAHLRRLWESGL